MSRYFAIPFLDRFSSLENRAGRARRAATRTCPAQFRNELQTEPGAPPLGNRIQPWQAADFAAIDPAWSRLATGRDAPGPRFRRAYLERPRGHSKTTDTAVQLVWALTAAVHPINGLVAAVDQEQARLVRAAMQRLASANPEMLGGLVFLENAVRNPSNGSLLKILSSDVRGSWGELPDFVVCDELCHWKSADLWHSLLSSAAKRPESVLMVLSNAGVGRGWQWDAREAARTDPDWHFSSLDGPQAPWITPAALEEQRRLLPPAVYARLWLNQWQHSDGEFVSLEETTACRDETRCVQDHGEPGRLYVASIDYAEKRDLTVGCICHRENGVVIVDRMDVVRPDVSRPTPVSWVSDWIHRTAAAFPGVRFIVDAHQLVSVVQSLASRYPIERYEFRAGQANFEMALLLRQLILERQVRWPAGCGIVPGEEMASPPDDLERELSSLVVRETTGGRFRFDHRNDGRSHDDRAFALGAACQTLLRDDDQPATIWEVTPPELGGLF